MYFEDFLQNDPNISTYSALQFYYMHIFYEVTSQHKGLLKYVY